MKVIDRKEEFIEYSKTHTLEETAEHFDIVKNYAQRLRREWCGIVVPKSKLTIDKNEFVSYKKKYGLSRTAEHFNISFTSAYHYAVKFGCHCYRKNTMEHILNGHDIKKELPEYAKEHTKKECAEYFGVTYPTVRWWCERYKIEPKTKVRNLKQVARMLYILDNGENLYYFTNYDDIAQFVGLTRTRVNVLISKEGKIHEYKVRKEKIVSYRFQADKKRTGGHKTLNS